MKITFFGHFGTSNTGNESTLLAMLSRLRRLYPEAEFCCICTYPDVLAAMRGIAAVPIDARTARLWDREAPIGDRVKNAFIGVAQELREYPRAFRHLAKTDMLIVPGTGLLTDAYGLFGWGPYNLFKWTVMAKLRGCRVLFVSVGAGPIYTTAGRFLVKAALSVADYRSYRDDASRNYLKRIGFHRSRDRVYPDLVFSLPKSLLSDAQPRVGQKRAVGVGLMMYAGRYSAPEPSAVTHELYMDAFTAFVEWLLGEDYSVRLLVGDADAVIPDLESRLRARAGAYDTSRVAAEPVATVEQIVGELAGTDVVVATRFHNVLLALLLEKPVLAISFHHKSASLMRQMGLAEYCHDIHQMDADWLIARFRELQRNEAQIKREIRDRVAQCRAALDEQYEVLFGATVGS